MKANSPKILVLDIETLPGKAYVWGLRDKYIPIERLIEPGRVVCASWQWVGEKATHFGAEWEENPFLGCIHEAMSEADAIVTYNGDHFDLAKLEGEFIAAGYPPIPPVASIDLYKKVAGLGYISGKLEYVAVALKIGQKVKHEGFKLWAAVDAADEAAQGRMERYNRQDVRLTTRLYSLLKRHLRNHPRLFRTPLVCSACGSPRVQHRGYRYTRKFKTERLACTDCGHWDTGKRSKL